jgi:hypothetical protein
MREVQYEKLRGFNVRKMWIIGSQYWNPEGSQSQGYYLFLF